MIAQTQNNRTKLVLYLKRSVVILAGAYLIVAGSLGVEILLRNSSASSTEHQAMLVSQDSKTTRAEIGRAKRIEFPSAPADLSAVSRLPSKLATLAANNKCSVLEFRASSDVVPYLTRFGTTAGAPGWGQVGVQFSLSGKAHDVVATLAALSAGDVLFEYDALEITRDQVNAAGDATVIGHATIRVLIRTSKDGA